MCRVLRRIHCDSTTRVEFAGMTRGQFLLARGGRQGCPGSGILFAMAFDPIFRWLQNAIIPRNPAGLDFLQPAQCAYADDLTVAAPSFRDLMTALAPAFQTVDRMAGLNLNHRKRCWVQYGSERHESLLNWLSDNCEDFREMQIVRYAKYVGTMIGRMATFTVGRHPEKIIQRVVKINASTKSLVERRCDFKICAVSFFKLYWFHLCT